MNAGMRDEEMQVLITKARRVAGYRGPGHTYWDMIFDAEAPSRRPVPALAGDHRDDADHGRAHRGGPPG
jgi:hypothetical protein